MQSTNPNNYNNQKLRGLKRKYEAILERGGKCMKCGYARNMAVLEFHHINPTEKKFQLDTRHFANSDLKKLQEELDKCILLCANCHREIHNPEYSMEIVSKIAEDCEKSSFSNEKRSEKICPVCGKSFHKVSGKKYCSKECRMADKRYPPFEDVIKQYKILGSWQKVADYFGLTRKIITGIRNRHL